MAAALARCEALRPLVRPLHSGKVIDPAEADRLRRHEVSEPWKPRRCCEQKSDHLDGGTAQRSSQARPSHRPGAADDRRVMSCACSADAERMTCWCGARGLLMRCTHGVHSCGADHALMKAYRQERLVGERSMEPFADQLPRGIVIQKTIASLESHSTSRNDASHCFRGHSLTAHHSASHNVGEPFGQRPACAALLRRP